MKPVGNLGNDGLTNINYCTLNLLRISAGLSVNLDQPLLEDGLDLLGVEGILQTVPELRLIMLVITLQLILYVVSFKIY